VHGRILVVILSTSVLPASLKLYALSMLRSCTIKLKTRQPGATATGCEREARRTCSSRGGCCEPVAGT
jgi:hypothetical protein